MKIKLLKEKVENFKGIKALDVQFGDNTIISGDNGTGKTSLYDAYLWCLFGKDSQDKKDFEIQPLDSKNNPIHHLETRVELTFSIDGIEKVFTRVLKEKWVKHRGQAEENLEGSISEFYIDEVPQKLKDFNVAVNNLIDSEVFKLVSNPLYFASLNWKKQREILFQIIGDVDDETVINYKQELSKLGELLGNGTVEDLKKKTKAQISKLKKDREGIQPRIDELSKQKSKLDWAGLEIEKRTLLSKVKEIDSQIADSSKKNKGKIKLQEQLIKAKEEYNNKLTSAKSKIQDELFKTKEKYNNKLAEAKKNAYKPNIELQKKINDVEYELSKTKANLVRENRTKDEINKDIETGIKLFNDFTKKKSDKLAEFHKVDDSVFTFDETQGHCPTCGRDYDNIEEIKLKAEELFNKDKELKKNNIIKEGKQLASCIDQYKKQIEEYKNKLDEVDKNINEIELKIDYLSNELGSFNKRLESLDHNEIDFEDGPQLRKQIADLSAAINNVTFEGQEELKATIEDIQAQIQAFKETDNSLLIKEKGSLQSQIESITKQLALQDNNSKIDKRIEELNTEEKELSVKIAELEGVDFLTEEFTRTKVELLEGKINSKFKTIRFKLFNNLNNGGIEDCCSILVNGVPYNSVNTAGRINAGVEVINALSEFYDVNSVLWLDNRESVNNLVETNSQVINLVVSEDKTLKVVNE